MRARRSATARAACLSLEVLCPVRKYRRCDNLEHPAATVSREHALVKLPTDEGDRGQRLGGCCIDRRQAGSDQGRLVAYRKLFEGAFSPALPALALCANGGSARGIPT